MNEPNETPAAPGNDYDSIYHRRRARWRTRVDEIREHRKANVLRRVEEAAEHARHVDEMADLYRFSDEIADRWHARESRNDPYYEAVRALWYGPGIYWGFRQIKDRLTAGERETFFAVKELLVDDPALSEREACRIVAERTGKAYATVRELYRRAKKKVEQIVKEATAA